MGELTTDMPDDPSSELLELSTYLASQEALDGSARDEIDAFTRVKLKEYWNEVRLGTATPWTFYRLALGYLFIRKPYPAFAACAKAIQLSDTAAPIETAARALSALDECDRELVGCQWIQRLLLVGVAGKFHPRRALSMVRRLATKNAPAIRLPVTILAGGCSADDHACFVTLRPLVVQAFGTYSGTIISGGTAMGVCSLAGDVQETFPDVIHAIGYVPRDVTDVPIDYRYREIRFTEGSNFSAIEPLQYWCDLIASGVLPSQVKLFGIDGGAISASEYKMALSLGASVALLEGSGREAKKLRHNRWWRSAPSLMCVPEDPYIIEEFVKPHSTQLATAEREVLAQIIHNAYREYERSITSADDPSLAPWNELLSDLKQSNRAQADRLFEKMERLGYRIERYPGSTAPVTEFTPEELDVLARMEHARWVVERLNGGWACAAGRDVRLKLSPYFVAWDDLPENVKEKERSVVRRIPYLLAETGLQICREQRQRTGG